MSLSVYQISSKPLPLESWNSHIVCVLPRQRSNSFRNQFYCPSTTNRPRSLWTHDAEDGTCSMQLWWSQADSRTCYKLLPRHKVLWWLSCLGQGSNRLVAQTEHWCIKLSSSNRIWTNELSIWSILLKTIQRIGADNIFISYRCYTTAAGSERSRRCGPASTRRSWSSTIRPRNCSSTSTLRSWNYWRRRSISRNWTSRSRTRRTSWTRRWTRSRRIANREIISFNKTL